MFNHRYGKYKSSIHTIIIIRIPPSLKIRETREPGLGIAVGHYCDYLMHNMHASITSPTTSNLKVAHCFD